MPPETREDHLAIEARRQRDMALDDLDLPDLDVVHPEGGSTDVLRTWVKVVTIYDDIDPGGSPPVVKHSSFGRCLGVKVQTLTFPTDGEDLSWADEGSEVVAFPDPIVLDALDQARADPDGLGTAIHLDDYYVIDQIYKADLVQEFYIVGREPFAIFGGPEYEAPP